MAFEGAGFIPIRELEFNLVCKKHLVVGAKHLDIFVGEFSALRKLLVKLTITVIKAVPHDREAHLGKMRTNLVLTPRDEFCFD